MTPPKEKIPVENYIDQIRRFVESEGQNIRYNVLYQAIDEERNLYTIKTDKGVYLGRKVIFAFGSNIPNELGVYGEAKTVAYWIENPEDYTGITTLVIGGGNAAADIVAALSRVKREADDPSPVFGGIFGKNSRSAKVPPGTSAKKSYWVARSKSSKEPFLKSGKWTRRESIGYISIKDRIYPAGMMFLCIRA